MRPRNGQVALYLVMALLAIAVLMLVNVNIFLAVRSKNRMMNAVDGAAIAVAKHQGALLNEIGQMNVEHLKAAILGEPWVGADGSDKMIQLRKLAFFGPIRGIALASEAAAEWGYESGAEPKALSGFRDHISEIRNNPDLYPPMEDGVNLWRDYADVLESALGDSPTVLPRYMEMVNPGSSGLFANNAFYDVIAGKAWCWFTKGNNAQYLDSDPSQTEPYEIRPVDAIPDNGEVFSLHITYKTWMDSGWSDEYVSGKGFSAKWTNFVCKVTGLTPESFSKDSYAASETESWAFYDKNWQSWSNPDDLNRIPFVPAREGDDGFPIAGAIKPEYDVAGCVAACMMLGHIQQIGKDDAKLESDKIILITADAKPLGTVEDLDGGGRAPVTAYHSFIAASSPVEKIFTEAQLVLVGAVPQSRGVSMESGWYDHVKKHGPQNPFPGCGYCSLWQQWSDPSFRASIRSWLQENADSCSKGGGGNAAPRGGTGYAH